MRYAVKPDYNKKLAKKQNKKTKIENLSSYFFYIRRFGLENELIQIIEYTSFTFL